MDDMMRLRMIRETFADGQRKHSMAMKADGQGAKALMRAYLLQARDRYRQAQAPAYVAECDRMLARCQQD